MGAFSVADVGGGEEVLILLGIKHDLFDMRKHLRPTQSSLKPPERLSLGAK
jgi:hypothetical protein